MIHYVAVGSTEPRETETGEFDGTNSFSLTFLPHL